MAMRFVARHTVGLGEAAAGAASGSTALAVQWIAGVDGNDWVFGSILAAVVAAAGALIAAGLRDRRALANELAAARQRITELEHRVDELTERLLRSGHLPHP